MSNNVEVAAQAEGPKHATGRADPMDPVKDYVQNAARIGGL